MSLIDNPEHARRLARAIISDVAIYNRDKVEQGIKDDTIFELLEHELEEGRCRRYSIWPSWTCS